MARRCKPTTSHARRLNRWQQPTLPPHCVDWLICWTNRVPTSSFSTANHLDRIRTHNLRHTHGRLNRLRFHCNLTASQVRQPSRGCFTLHFSFFPEHYSLWAWGCHSQKTANQSLIIPAAWAKRKRTGRLKKVRLFWGGTRLSSSPWQTAWILTMPEDWQTLFSSFPYCCNTI